MDSFGFKTQGINYQKFRPRYPHELLFKPLAALKSRNRYLDIATGTGQILFELAKHFKYAQGIDISDQMVKIALGQGDKYQNIKIYKCAVQDIKTSQAYDYITVGQAFHFFRKEEALVKIKQILSEEGIFSVYGYIPSCLTEENGQKDVDKDKQLFNEFYKIVKPYFEFDRDDLHNHYSDKKKYPFEDYFPRVQRQIVDVGIQMTKEQFIGYLKTFSGYNYFLQKNKQGVDPIKKLQSLISPSIVLHFDFFRISCFRTLQK